MQKAIILSIGDELTLGQSLDTNSQFLSAHLSTLGIPTLYHQTVPDDFDMIIQAIQQATQSAHLVIVTGGLGPTDDDLTRQAIARAMDTELVMDEPSLRQIEARFMKRGWPMPARNSVQALCPRGAAMMDNDCGTAPGIKAQVHKAMLYAMPGVPLEMVAMFTRHVLPALESGSNHVILTATLHTHGLGESSVNDLLGELMDRQRNPKVGTTVANGVVSVRICSEFPTKAQAQAQLEETAALCCQRLGDLFYGRDDQTLAHTLGNLLRRQGKKLATVESCTGGLLGKLLTDAPGSSDYYLGGWVTYANEMKEKLGVSGELLRLHGAVSQSVAQSLAENAARTSGADYALSITGIAGPDGGSADKPVGTVWIGLANRVADRISVTAEKFNLGTDRAMVRLRAANTAMDILRRHLLAR